MTRSPNADLDRLWQRHRYLQRELLVHKVPDTPRRLAELLAQLSWDQGQEAARVGEQRELARALGIDKGDCERAIVDLEERAILRVLRQAGSWWYELLADASAWQPGPARRRRNSAGEMVTVPAPVTPREDVEAARAAWLRLEAENARDPAQMELIDPEPEQWRDGGMGAARAEASRQAADARVCMETSAVAPAAAAGDGFAWRAERMAQIQAVIAGRLGNSQSAGPEDGGAEAGRLGISQSAAPVASRMAEQLRDAGPAKTSPGPAGLGISQSDAGKRGAAVGKVPIGGESERAGLGNSQPAASPARGASAGHDHEHGVPTEHMSHDHGPCGREDHGAAGSGALSEAMTEDLWRRYYRLFEGTRENAADFAETWRLRMGDHGRAVAAAIGETEIKKRQGEVKKTVGGTLNFFFLRFKESARRMGRGLKALIF